MAASTSKRVVAVRFDREAVAGFVDPGGFMRPDGIEVLSPAGELAVLPMAEVKALCFVRDFESFPGWRGGRLFNARPKTEGLWVRFQFRDGDQIDGILPANLLAWETHGFTIAPPDPTFQNQRIFLPRTAIAETQLLGVVGPRRPRRPKTVEGQLEMFDR